MWLVSKLIQSLGFSPMKDSENSPTKDKCRELASFVVEFSVSHAGGQGAHDGVSENDYLTRVHHIEAGDTKEWQGIAPVEASEWFARVVSKDLTDSFLMPASLNQSCASELSLSVEGRGLGEVSSSENKVSTFLGLHLQSTPLSMRICVKASNLNANFTVGETIPVALHINGYQLDDEGAIFVELACEHVSVAYEETLNVECLFEGLELRKGFYRLFGMAILYLEEPVVISSKRHLIQIV